jgi:hypothetical protein
LKELAPQISRGVLAQAAGNSKSQLSRAATQANHLNVSSIAKGRRESPITNIQSPMESQITNHQYLMAQETPELQCCVLVTPVIGGWLLEVHW